MYVCICHAVSEDEILDAVSDGAQCTIDVMDATQAGSGCGSCLLRLGEVVDEALSGCPRRRFAAASNASHNSNAA
ncbi:MAG: (2Fe-2S)-binding protein [Sporichthyaceae bacterium]